MATHERRPNPTWKNATAWGVLLLALAPAIPGPAVAADVCRYRTYADPRGMGFSNDPHIAWQSRQTHAIGEFIYEAGIKYDAAHGYFPSNTSELTTAWSSSPTWLSQNLFTGARSNPVEGVGGTPGAIGYMPIWSQGANCGCVATVFGRSAIIATLTIGCGDDPPVITRPPRTLEDRLAEDAAKAK